MVIDIIMKGFSLNKAKGHFHTCDHSIVTFVIIGCCSGFSNTYHVDSLDRFIKLVVNKVKVDILILIPPVPANVPKISRYCETEILSKVIF